LKTVSSFALQFEILHDQYPASSQKREPCFDFSVTLRSLFVNVFSRLDITIWQTGENRHVALIVWNVHMTAPGDTSRMLLQ